MNNTFIKLVFLLCSFLTINLVAQKAESFEPCMNNNGTPNDYSDDYPIDGCQRISLFDGIYKTVKRANCDCIWAGEHYGTMVIEYADARTGQLVYLDYYEGLCNKFVDEISKTENGQIQIIERMTNDTFLLNDFSLHQIDSIVQLAETKTFITDNGDGTFTYLNEDSTNVEIKLGDNIELVRNTNSLDINNLPISPNNPPANPIEDDNLIESFAEGLIFWTYKNNTWELIFYHSEPIDITNLQNAFNTSSTEVVNTILQISDATGNTFRINEGFDTVRVRKVYDSTDRSITGIQVENKSLTIDSKPEHYTLNDFVSYTSSAPVTSLPVGDTIIGSTGLMTITNPSLDRELKGVIIVRAQFSMLERATSAYVQRIWLNENNTGYGVVNSLNREYGGSGFRRDSQEYSFLKIVTIDPGATYTVQGRISINTTISRGGNQLDSGIVNVLFLGSTTNN